MIANIFTRKRESKIERHFRMLEKHGFSSTLFWLNTNTQTTFPEQTRSTNTKQRSLNKQDQRTHKQRFLNKQDQQTLNQVPFTIVNKHTNNVLKEQQTTFPETFPEQTGSTNTKPSSFHHRQQTHKQRSQGSTNNIP